MFKEAKKKLVMLADSLDSKGFKIEADMIDKMIKAQVDIKGELEIADNAGEKVTVEFKDGSRVQGCVFMINDNMFSISDSLEDRERDEMLIHGVGLSEENVSRPKYNINDVARIIWGVSFGAEPSM